MGFVLEEHVASPAIRLILSACAVLGAHGGWALAQEWVLRTPGFTFPLFMTLVQCLVSSLLAFSQLSQGTARRVPLKIYVGLALCSMVSIGATNTASSMIGYVPQVAGKSLKLAIVMVGGMIMGQRFKGAEWMAAVMVCVGVPGFLLATAKSDGAAFDIRGVGLLAVALAADSSVYNIQEHICFKKYHAPQNEVAAWSYLFAAIQTLCFILLNGEFFPATKFCLGSPSTLGLIVLFSCLAYVGIIAILYLTEHFGGNVAVITTNMRKVLTISFSFFVFSRPFTVQHFLSAVLIFCGLFLHAASKRRSELYEFFAQFLATHTSVLQALVLLGAVALGSTGYAAMGSLAAFGVPSLQRAQWRLLVTGLVMLPGLVHEAGGVAGVSRLKIWTDRNLAMALLKAAVAYSGFNVLINVALGYTTLVHVTLLCNTAPIILLVYSILTIGFSVVSKREVIGLGLDVVGVFLPMLDDSGEGTGRTGDLLSLLAAVCFSIYLRSGSTMKDRLGPLTFISLVCLQASVFLTVMICSIEGFSPSVLGTSLFGWTDIQILPTIVFIGVVPGGCNAVAQWCNGKMGATAVATAYTLEPLFGTAVGVMLGVSALPRPWTAIGGAFLLTGLYCVVSAPPTTPRAEVEDIELARVHGGNTTDITETNWVSSAKVPWP